MKRLYIWGALENLPSIDTECIATLAYLMHHESVDDLEIIAGFDPSMSPNGDFPLLEVGGKFHAGYASIAEWSSNSMDKSASSGESASSQLQGDISAWSSFIQQKGQALVDLYLYASSNNYWNTVSPAFTKILPWYANYTIPPTRRAAAIARTKHLGIRSLDLDSIDEFAAGDDVRLGDQSTPAAGAGPLKPEDLIKKQQSARWLKAQTTSDAFQLHQLTEAFFAPLEALLGDKQWLITDEGPTSLDYVALGYLSLMAYADVPQSWLGDALRTRHPRLHAYTERLYQETFNNDERPWRSKLRQTPEPTIAETASSIGQSILHWVYPSSRKTFYQDSAADQALIRAHPFAKPNSLISAILSPTILLPLGAIAGLAFGVTKYVSMSDTKPRRGPREHVFYVQQNDSLPPTSLNELGEAGSFFSALGPPIGLDAASQREQERMGGATVVEVDVENEKGEVGRDVIIRR